MKCILLFIFILFNIKKAVSIALHGKNFKSRQILNLFRFFKNVVWEPF